MSKSPSFGTPKFRPCYELGDTPPKQRADEESLGAAWLTLDEIRARPLRGHELADLLAAVAAGAAVHPLALLGGELSV